MTRRLAYGRLERAIGLSRGAIFHHFRDKDTLFFRTGPRGRRADGGRGVPRGPDPGDARPAGRAQQFDLVDDPGWRSPGSPRRPSVPPGLGAADQRELFTAATTERLKQQKQAGRLRDDVPERGAADPVGLGPRRTGGATGVRRRSRTAQCRTGSGRGVGAPAVAGPVVVAVVRPAAATHGGAGFAQHAVNGTIRAPRLRNQ